MTTLLYLGRGLRDFYPCGSKSPATRLLKPGSVKLGWPTSGFESEHLPMSCKTGGMTGG